MITNGQFTYEGLFYTWDYNERTEVLWMKRIAAVEEIYRGRMDIQQFIKLDRIKFFHEQIDNFNAHGHSSQIIYDDERPPEWPD